MRLGIQSRRLIAVVAAGAVMIAIGLLRRQPSAARVTRKGP